MTLLNSYFENKTFSNEKIRNDYQVVIQKLLNEFGDNLEKIESKLLIDFLSGPFTKYERKVKDEFITKTYAVKTYEKNINYIRSFLNMIFELDLIDINYANYIEVSTQNRQVRFDELPSAEHIIAIQEYLYQQPIETDYYALRDLVIFNLIFHSGVSTEDLANLTLSDVGFQGKDDYVIICKSRDNGIAINLEDAKYLSHLLKLREKEMPKDNSIFISQKLKSGLTRRAFSYIVNGFCTKKDVLINVEGNTMPVFSAEKFKKAGITAALSIGYAKDQMREELQVSPKYFNNRFKYVDHPNVSKRYADLFKR